MRTNPQMIEWVNSRPPELIPAYLRQDRENMLGELLRVPGRDEIPVNINETLIVEFYAR